MLGRMRQILQQPSTAEPATNDGTNPRALATVALLFHAASQDGSIDRDEEQTIAKLATKHFALTDEQSAALVAEARRIEEDANQILHFTRDIKNHSNHRERVALIEMLWEVVFADGEEHAFESNLMRRVAGLIYVTDQESGAARRRVRERLDLA